MNEIGNGLKCKTVMAPAACYRALGSKKHYIKRGLLASLKKVTITKLTIAILGLFTYGCATAGKKESGQSLRVLYERAYFQDHAGAYVSGRSLLEDDMGLTFRLNKSNYQQFKSGCEITYKDYLVELDQCYVRSGPEEINLKFSKECLDIRTWQGFCHLEPALDGIKHSDPKQIARRIEFLGLVSRELRCNETKIPDWTDAFYKNLICKKYQAASRIVEKDGVAIETAERIDNLIREETKRIMSRECRRYGDACGQIGSSVFEDRSVCNLYDDCLAEYSEKAIKSLKKLRKIPGDS
ncbi:MAG: hypothetical protein KF713_11305 [Turneriella sp.]|nr:hypothetical protein [Turneriella sp.]